MEDLASLRKELANRYKVQREAKTPSVEYDKAINIYNKNFEDYYVVMGLKVVKLEPLVYRMHKDIYAGRRKTTALSEFGKSVERGYVKVLENKKLGIEESYLEIGSFTFILPFSDMPYISGFNI